MNKFLITVVLALSGNVVLAQTGDADAQVAALEQKIARLEARLRALENRKTHQVTAPFSVVDVNKRTRLRMGVSGNDSVLVLYNEDGAPTLGMRAQKAGAQVSLFAPDGTQVGTFGSTDIGAGITLAQADASKFTEIDSDEGFMLSTKGGKRLATIAATGKGAGLTLSQADGSTHTELDSAEGVMLRSGKSGKQMVQLWTDGRYGSIDLYSHSSGKSSAQIKTVEAGSGVLALTDAEGNLMVIAGTNANGVGAIKMGPDGEGPAAAMSGGRPASSLVGVKNKK